MSVNSKFNRQAGFSMMELLISLGMMAIITGAAFALIGSSLKFSNSTFHITDAEQTMRTAHEIVNRDLTTSGDGLKGIGTIQVPVGFVSSYLTQTPITCPSTSSYVCMSMVQSDDNVAGTTAVPQSSPAVNVLAGNDRLTLLTQDTSFTPVTLLAGKITVSGSTTNIAVTATDLTRFAQGEMYAIVAGNSAAFGVITGINTSTNTLQMANGDVYGINQTGAGTPINVVSAAGANPTSIMRIQIIHYYVNANNLLMRRVFGVRGSTFIDSVVAEHVTNLQFRYLVNLPDANGFVQQPKRQLASSQEQQAVREVETTVAVETVRAVNQVTANNNGKQAVSTTTATTLRNLQFRQAL
ncbi:MAG: hypothetical protein QOI20_3375 [Acidimicrobiaceae bacterium]|jgi:hypothetical protein|nr:hypothetical protein [Acidimicrobiaceae bacterium]